MQGTARGNQGTARGKGRKARRGAFGVCLGTLKNMVEVLLVS